MTKQTNINYITITTRHKGTRKPGAANPSRSTSTRENANDAGASIQTVTVSASEHMVLVATTVRISTPQLLPRPFLRNTVLYDRLLNPGDSRRIP